MAAQHWADLGDSQHGFSLINDSKFGYHAVGNLLRSPVSPDPDADRGPQHFAYALYPHAGDWKQALTVRHGYEFNFRLTAIQVDPHAGAVPAEHSFAMVAPEDVVLTAMKKAEDSDALVFHIYEWAGTSANVELTPPPGATTATETNLLERPEGAPLAISAGHLTLPIRSYEILTVRVDYPKPAQ